ncbi:MAG: hypothetical protein PW789_06320 [Edaphobacter sp.]|uniref:hypothetical protein n=1 Tax=Edaphobacter sp. TaxID=1934404 RepID=UPI0023888BAC|nr:hypothetical protein [Edaphobacter sp.]MDE1176209.1 hypothetical protein [Edaphobacter sp.]
MPSDRRHYVLLPLAAFLAVLPLLLRGCSCGHDFDFHIISWFEAARQFAHGTLHPHWAYTPAWNAGEPRFVFYPPLSWTLGGLLGLLLPWPWTPIVFTWIALTAAGFALHHAVRGFATANAALLAAAIYITNPYTLYTVYERTAYAELLAAAWLPLLLHAVLRERTSIRSIAVPIALLWLTNAPAAVMGCYAAAAIMLLRIVFARLRKTPLPQGLILRSIAGVLLGLGLAAFYIIPAVYERHFVQISMAILPGLSPHDNFLFRHTTDPDHDTVLRTASILALVVIALTTTILLALYLRKDKSNPQALLSRRSRQINASELLPLLLALTLLIAFMLTPLSEPLWNGLPQLRFLQFPWRLLAIVAVVFAFGVALAASHLRERTGALAALAAIAFTLPAYAAFHQICYPEDTLAERLAIFQSANPGTDPTDEYTPVTGDNDVLAKTNPAYWLASSASSAPPPGSVSSPAPSRLDLAPTAPAILVLNLRDYPAWTITRNGQTITTRLHRDDGLIALPLPAGPSHIRLVYTTPPDQNLGYLLSTLCLLALTMIIVRNARASGIVFPEEPAEVRILSSLP